MHLYDSYHPSFPRYNLTSDSGGNANTFVAFCPFLGLSAFLICLVATSLGSFLEFFCYTIAYMNVFCEFGKLLVILGCAPNTRRISTSLLEPAVILNCLATICNVGFLYLLGNLALNTSYAQCNSE